MPLVEGLEGRGHLRHHRSRVGEVHAADVVELERVNEALGLPLLFGMHTGVLTGFKSNCRAVCRVSAAM